MSPHSRNNSNRYNENLMRLMQRAKQKMAPHMARMETPEGLTACLLISGVAAAIVGGTENEAALATVAKQASEISGIPIDAMMAHAECAFAMMNGSVRRHRPKHHIKRRG